MRLNPRRRAAIKARKAKTAAFEADQQNLQNGPVKSGLSKFNYAGSVRGPRLSADHDRPLLAGRTSLHLPVHGRSSLMRVGKAPAFTPAPSLGYSVAHGEQPEHERKRRILRMCRKARAKALAKA